MRRLVKIPDTLHLLADGTLATPFAVRIAHQFFHGEGPQRSSEAGADGERNIYEFDLRTVDTPQMAHAQSLLSTMWSVF